MKQGELFDHGGTYIIGLHGCYCHPFPTWEVCDRFSKQRLKVGSIVKHRCKGGEGKILEVSKDNPSYCIVNFNYQDQDTVPSDQELQHMSNLIQIS